MLFYAATFVVFLPTLKLLCYQVENVKLNKRLFLAYLRERKIPYTNQHQVLQLRRFVICFTPGDYVTAFTPGSGIRLFSYSMPYGDPVEVMKKLNRLHQKVFYESIYKDADLLYKKHKKKCLNPNIMPLSSMRQTRAVLIIT
jgi:hypothetical protein